MSRDGILADGLPTAGPYSHAVRTNNGLVYLSGQTPFDPATNALVVGGVPEQTRQCFANLATVLAAAGLSFADVVKCNVYLTDMGDFAEMNAVYAEQFSAPFPARTTVAVAALPLGAQIEIELIAQS